MTKVRIASLALAFVCLMTIATAFAQNPATWGTYAGRYGLTGWAINNQRVASQYNYYIDSTFQTAVGALFTFPQSACTLNMAGNKNIVPFAANATVKIVDVNSANTETVNGVAPTLSAGQCFLGLSPANTHTSGSYTLRSGTCGLQEAINDMGTNGGEVIVDQKFYDDGCTQATITGLNPLVTSTSGPIRSNIYVHDISNGQDTWYELKPTTTTLISAPTYAVGNATSTTGGSLANSTTYDLQIALVDALGGISLPSSQVTPATGSSGTALALASPAAATGAVGWQIYFASSSGAEILLAPGVAGISGCTQTPLESITPACAMTNTPTILNTTSSTAKPMVESTAHTTFAFQPMNTSPYVAGQSAAFQTTFLPFAQVATISAGANADLGTLYVPAGYFNYLGKAVDVCVKLNYSVTSTGIPTVSLTAANQYAQSPVTLASIILPTQAAAATTAGCFTIQTAATGSSGTFWASGTLVQTLNSTGAGAAASDVTTAVSSAVNLTQGVYLSINVGATTASVTSATLNALYIRPAAGN